MKKRIVAATAALLMTCGVVSAGPATAAPRAAPPRGCTATTNPSGQAIELCIRHNIDKATAAASLTKLRAEKARTNNTASSAGAAAAPKLPTVIPTYCFTSAPQGGTTYPHVTDGCMADAGELDVRQVPSGKQIGTIDFSGVDYIWEPNTQQTGWYMLYEYGVTSESPAGISKTFSMGRYTEQAPYCAGSGSALALDCHDTSADFPEQPFTLDVLDQGYAHFAMSTIPRGRADIMTSGISLGFSTSNPAIYNGLVAEEPRMQMQCDNAEPGNNVVAGCRSPSTGFTPTVTFSGASTSYGAVSNHIYYAITHGAPRTLGRIGDATTMTSNRNKSCNSSRIPSPRPAGYSCDEYPFASTAQGGASGGTLFTASYCQLPKITARSGSFSACLVPATDNTNAGIALVGFYNRDRVLVYDGKYVDILNVGKFSVNASAD